MISARAVELRAGARLLLEAATFQVSAGDKIGLVGRNGAGKTTLARVLAAEALPAAGQVTTGGSVGYLPQDTMVGDLDALALDRILSARGLDSLLAALRAAARTRVTCAGPRLAELRPGSPDGQPGDRRSLVTVRC